MANVQEVTVPDLGGADEVDVIELLVKPGDQVAEEDALVTLESDKASMDVPSPLSGVVKELKVNVGDKVTEGSLLLTVEVEGEAASDAPAQAPTEQAAPQKAQAAPAAQSQSAPSASAPQSSANVQALEKAAQASAVDLNVHASPAVRRIASEFGVDLRRIQGTGPKSRITKEDVQTFVKQQLVIAQTGGGASGSALPKAPVVDFTKFGEVETKALNKIKKLTATNLSRNWLLAPHVTQFDEADITELEDFRKARKAEAEKQGFKLTPLVFIMKAVVAALRQYPHFNASLSQDGQSLVMKKYFHIGVAVDTPNGLVVPVIRDVDQKSVFHLAKELGEVSLKARDGKLLPKDMQGGCFTISSLGGIGGTAFTPIINLPEVAILGVSRAQVKPVFKEGKFEPCLKLPMSLSYDHRVIDGADGARFITHISQMLSDLRCLIL
ncbi:MAG: dihydrolipoyllysine-residue acetyltransferase [Gammaproteobacteria bacterium]